MSVAAISSERIESDDNVWTRRLVLFLRIMAVVSVIKGLYHWAQVTGFVGGEEDAFENQPMAWQTATVYFAVIELVAAVGLWLATPWGAVVWLTTVVSMAVIELMFPGNLWRQPDGGWCRSPDAGRLSRAGLDGCARTAAIAVLRGHSREKCRATPYTMTRLQMMYADLRKIGGRIYRVFRGNVLVTLTGMPHPLRRSFQFEGCCSHMRQGAPTKREQGASTLNERLPKALYSWA